uniref:Uncharacterized protein n=1 Tax=Aplanochytrium stocchinoi TaxID=215587 RepID=A0A6S8ESH7_9STRA|mmetsp:Transcript_3418/g.4309  ORF Transcript_3418/g.4309 Transcript_3418/m.4309 type:complete len:227 (+) Transcript_3418:164-844(+)|eukprot:CAMPEP_0204840618 /NCGR_PEP_ID=MMETSP1346-20131115/38313_1 /ASSEMBLY_ACC=CAM_ASM_000771 /TAXON_ID=215587 /ORGANISM="Aplanochytrium stocchinoi, Strain GSBS06" /LENGTH=226 /DNA_ID=CAMNT_0051978135 /DNA_START=58 /DNA_END=738 /DNA_ORIENTATION=+
MVLLKPVEKIPFNVDTIKGKLHMVLTSPQGIEISKRNLRVSDKFRGGNKLQVKNKTNHSAPVDILTKFEKSAATDYADAKPIKLLLPPNFTKRKSKTSMSKLLEKYECETPKVRRLNNSGSHHDKVTNGSTSETFVDLQKHTESESVIGKKSEGAFKRNSVSIIDQDQSISGLVLASLMAIITAFLSTLMLFLENFTRATKRNVKAKRRKSRKKPSYKKGNKTKDK